MTLSAAGVRGYLDHKFRAPPSNTTAQLPTLHQLGNTEPTTSTGRLPFSSGTQTTFEQSSPIQALTKLNVNLVSLY